MPSPFDQDLHNFKQGEVDNLSLGQNGATLESGTTSVTGKFFCIFFIEDTVFASLTNDPAWTGDAITTVTFLAGTYIYGRFTAFQLTSGAVLAYKFEDDPA